MVNRHFGVILFYWLVQIIFNCDTIQDIVLLQIMLIYGLLFLVITYMNYKLLNMVPFFGSLGILTTFRLPYAYDR